MIPEDRFDELQLEEALRDGLTRLADQAPPGPQPEQVRQALRRRSRRRRALFSLTATAALAAAALAAFFPPAGPRSASPSPIAVQTAAAPAAPTAPAAETLPKKAGAAAIEASLRRLFDELGARSGQVSKLPSSGVSFAFAGKITKPPAEVRDELERLLADYALVTIDKNHEQLSYSLLSY